MDSLRAGDDVVGAVGAGAGDGASPRDGAWPEGPLADAELTALALAAPLDGMPASDAVPMSVYLRQEPGLLPTWYMPIPMARIHSRWRLPVVITLVVAFVVIEAFGLCSTFGQVVPA